MEKEGAVEAADLRSVLDYIQEREGNLARATEKLRRNVERIADVFGDRNHCQICGHRKEDGNHFRYFDRRDYRGYNEIPDRLHGQETVLVAPNFDRGRWGNPDERKTYIQEHEFHEFVSKIYVSRAISDTDTFYETEEEEFFLHINGSGLDVEVDFDGEFDRSVEIADLSREAVKELVKSGRITGFLHRVAEVLEEKGQEYEEVAEVAERLAAALPSIDAEEAAR